MKKYQLQKIDVISAAKIYLAFGVVFGVIFGGFTLLALIVQNPTSLPLTLIGGFFMIILYSLFGAGMTALMMWLYNKIADRIGGITIYLSEEQHLTPGPIPKEPNRHDDPTLI